MQHSLVSFYFSTTSSLTSMIKEKLVFFSFFLSFFPGFNVQILDPHLIIWQRGGGGDVHTDRRDRRIQPSIHPSKSHRQQTRLEEESALPVSLLIWTWRQLLPNSLLFLQHRIQGRVSWHFGSPNHTQTVAGCNAILNLLELSQQLLWHLESQIPALAHQIKLPNSPVHLGHQKQGAVPLEDAVVFGVASVVEMVPNLSHLLIIKSIQPHIPFCVKSGKITLPTHRGNHEEQELLAPNTFGSTRQTAHSLNPTFLPAICAIAIKLSPVLMVSHHKLVGVHFGVHNRVCKSSTHPVPGELRKLSCVSCQGVEDKTLCGSVVDKAWG